MKGIPADIPGNYGAPAEKKDMEALFKLLREGGLDENALRIIRQRGIEAFLAQLQIGRTLGGQLVQALGRDRVIVNFGGHNLVAEIPEDMGQYLKPGDFLRVRVEELQPRAIFRLISADRGPAPEQELRRQDIVELLHAQNIPASRESIDAVRYLMKYNLPIERASIAEIIEEFRALGGTIDLEPLVFLKSKGISASEGTASPVRDYLGGNPTRLGENLESLRNLISDPRIESALSRMEIESPEPGARRDGFPLQPASHQIAHRVETADSRQMPLADLMHHLRGYIRSLLPLLDSIAPEPSPPSLKGKISNYIRKVGFDYEFALREAAQREDALREELARVLSDLWKDKRDAYPTAFESLPETMRTGVGRGEKMGLGDIRNLLNKILREAKSDGSPQSREVAGRIEQLLLRLNDHEESQRVTLERAQESLKGQLMRVREALRNLLEAQEGQERASLRLSPSERGAISELMRSVSETLRNLDMQQIVSQPPAREGIASTYLYFQIPIKGEDGRYRTHELKVYYRKRKNGKVDPRDTSIAMILDMSNLGLVGVWLTLTGNRINMLFNLENERAKSIIDSNIPELRRSLEDMKYYIGSIRTSLITDRKKLVEETDLELPKLTKLDIVV
ncbi:MAG: flagellar hook-length control protein FliK [bacterium]